MENSFTMENPQCKKSVNLVYKTLLANNLETETAICVFFSDVLKTLFKISGRKFLLLRSTLGKIRSYNIRELSEHKAVSFDEIYDRFAYIFAYGVIHSVIMYYRFSNMLKFNQTLLKKIATMKIIRLCFLGGGPALEAISLSKLLNDIIKILSNGEHETLNVFVTIVDISPEWKKEGEFIINTAQNKLWDSNNIKIHFSFVEADLTEDFSEDLRKVIKNAHIVTMFKFLSDVNNASYSRKEIPNMVNLILKCMSFKACLFYLDSSGGGLFNKIDRLIDKYESTIRIYGPCSHKCHILNTNCVEKLSALLEPIFGYLHCTTQCTISCSAWLKVRNVLKVDGLICNTIRRPVKVLRNDEELQWRKREPKIKKVLQLPAVFREICAVPSDKETDTDTDEETEKSD